jgi:hypothetical protein
MRWAEMTTDERIAALKNMTHLSALEAATQLDAPSRNCIIGYRNRHREAIGQPCRVMSGRKPKGKRAEPKPFPRAEMKPKAKAAEPAPKPARPKPLVERAPAPRPVIVETQSAGYGPTSLLEVRDDQCRRPLYGTGRDMMFCGAEVLTGRWYCAGCRPRLTSAWTTGGGQSKAEVAAKQEVKEAAE